jgi:hypothetical protein
MTFTDVPVGEPFKDYDGVTYVKLSDATADTPGTARGPRWRWRASSVFEFSCDDEVQEWCRWKTP